MSKMLKHTDLSISAFIAIGLMVLYNTRREAWPELASPWFSITFYLVVSLLSIAALRHASTRSTKKRYSFMGMTGITPLRDFTPTNEVPLKVYHEPFLKSKKFVLSMGLRKCTLDDFMVFDRNYPARMEARRQIEADHPEDTLKCLPEAAEAASEALQLIVETLTRRYPTMFREVRCSSNDGERLVQNIITGETVDVGPNLRGVAALSSISRLSEDDVIILQYDEDAGSYVATAAASTFPNGFSFISKIGLTLSSIHKPVPNYKEKLEVSMDRYFHKLESGKLVLRYNWGITPHAKLYATSGTHLREDEDISEVADLDVQLDDCHVRCERQILQRLPQSKALLFTVKTYLFPVKDIAHEDGVAENLRGAVEGLGDRMGHYKGRPRWERAVVPYLDDIIAQNRSKHKG